MPRSRSRSPSRRGYDRHRRKRSRSPYQQSRRNRSRSRSPRRRRSKSRSPVSRRPRSPHGRQHYSGRPEKEQPWKPSANPMDMTLGGSLGVTGKKKPKKKKASNAQLVMADMTEMTDEDKMMQQIMGFQSFDTTKGKKVSGNDAFAVNKKVERKYRQYMNRKGGFNRPLEFMP